MSGDEDRAERQRYARKPSPARPKTAIALEGGIRPVNGPEPTPPPLELLPKKEPAPKFEFAQGEEEPQHSPDIDNRLDDTSAFHIFSLVLRALRKVDKPTRRRIIGLLNELEMEQ